MARETKWRAGALLGSLVSAALIGWLYLAHQWLGWPFVPFDIAQLMVRLTPGAVATAGIEALGEWAQRLLKVAGMVLMLGTGAVLGAWAARPNGETALAVAWRHFAGRTLLLAAVVFVATLAVEIALGWGLAPVLPSTLGLAAAYLVWAGVVSWGAARLREEASHETAAARAGARRAFLARLGAVTLGVAAGSFLLGRRLGSAPKPAALPPLPAALVGPDPGGVLSTAGAATSPAPVALPNPEEGGVATGTGLPPPGTPLPEFLPAPGTRLNLTPVRDFYIVNVALIYPAIDVQRWQLEIKGLVRTPQKLGFPDLLRVPRIDVDGTLECISNDVGGDLISTTRFNGLRLRDLLLQAGPAASVVEVKMRSADGYTESIPFDKAMDPATLLVYGMNGLTLPREHGYPLRVYNPNHYGMKNPKWLLELELLDRPYDGYWEARGWDKTARVKTTSVTDTRGELPVREGVIQVGGIAFAGWRGIDRVEVQIDGGEWQPAILDQPLSRFTWVRWRYDWRTPPPGEHKVTVRAVDGEGQLQTAAEALPHPDGASGWFTTTVVA